MNVLQGLLLSRNTFHVGTWPILHHKEYQCFKVAIIRLYKLLLLKDGQEEETDEKKLESDEAVCLAIDLPHPAVLVRYFRLCTGVRLAAKAPREFWEVMYAARGARRSWLEAFMSDIRWLKRPSSPFSLFEDTNLCEFMRFAASPVIALRAIRKACSGPEALTAALADMPIVARIEVAQSADGPIVVPLADEPTVLQCDECPYTCSTRKQLLYHSRVANSHRHPINKCVDTTYCPVCGIDRHTRAGILVHLHDRTPICRLNLLMRGEHVSDEAAAVLAAEAAGLRASNTAAGRDKHFAELRCVRIYGPFLPVGGLDGDIIQSKNGHPLGPNRVWNRPARLNSAVCKKFLFWDHGSLGCTCAECTALPPRVHQCPASLYVQCTVECALCRGRGLDPTVFAPL